MATFTIPRFGKTQLIYLLYFILLLTSWHILSSPAKQIFKQLHEQAIKAKWTKPSKFPFVQKLIGKTYSKSFPSL